jgi:hypothetical protein
MNFCSEDRRRVDRPKRVGPWVGHHTIGRRTDELRRVALRMAVLPWAGRLREVRIREVRVREVRVRTVGRRRMQKGVIRAGRRWTTSPTGADI